MSVNFIEIEEVTANSSASEIALHNQRRDVDIELTKDCEECLEFPVFGYYCKRHTCVDCGKFDEYGSYLCAECIPF